MGLPVWVELDGYVSAAKACVFLSPVPVFVFGPDFDKFRTAQRPRTCFLVMLPISSDSVPFAVRG